MTLIRTPDKGRILFAAEALEGGKRYLRVRRWFADGSFRDEYQEMPDSSRPLLFIPGLGDVDDVALRDIVQKAQEQPRQPRDKPDVPRLYQEMQDNRRMELSGKRRYGMWPRRKQ